MFQNHWPQELLMTTGQKFLTEIMKTYFKERKKKKTTFEREEMKSAIWEGKKLDTCADKVVSPRQGENSGPGTRGADSKQNRGSAVDGSDKTSEGKSKWRQKHVNTDGHAPHWTEHCILLV